MARRDYVLLSVPAVIGGIIILAIFFLDIQLANFQKAYFRELANETRRNNALIVRACRELDISTVAVCSTACGTTPRVRK